MDQPQGRLDDLVLFRFGLLMQSGGGIEEHLRIVDRVLLERNRMTILRAYLTRDASDRGFKTELLGRGRLVWAPMELRDASERSSAGDPSALFRLLWPGPAGRILAKAAGSMIRRSPLRRKSWLQSYGRGVGELVRSLHARYGFHLAVLHTLNSLDDAEAIGEFLRLDAPYAVVHHFENARLARPTERLKWKRAAAIGGISTVDVPRALRSRFMSLGEGVDGDFFRFENASPAGIPSGDPVIFLPARIERSKGQRDMVEALGRLTREGVGIRLALAGRVSSDVALEELKAAIARLPEPGRVLLPGNLDQAELRNWYAACQVVVLPSHSEGLGRTILEAQLMKRPVVAYRVGGASQAMIDGQTGFLVGKGDIGGLAAKIKRLLGDEPGRQRMGEKGREFVLERFDPVRAAISHEDFCLRALAGHRRDSGLRT